VHRFFSDHRITVYEPVLGHENVRTVVAGVLEQARHDGTASSYEGLSDVVLHGLAKAASQTLLAVINATGVMLHTNLGRAPISRAAWDAAGEIATGYSNIEFDLDSGRRDSRYSRVSAILRELSGAEDAIVVNNCAAAVVLILDTFARNRDVIVARNELIEIGGEFRLPEVFARSGAHLVEVGAANKVYLRDYERTLSAKSALLFRSHFSNFRTIGFTERVGGAELAQLGRRVGVPVVEDLGSGALIDLERFGLPHERTVREAVREGLELVAFSADKLLGGPQAGVIVGRRAHTGRLRENPLIRALRVDKVTIALLAQTLSLYRSEETLLEIPLFAMLDMPIDALRARAQRYVDALSSISVVASQGCVGGGSLPANSVPSVAIAVRDPEGRIEGALRSWIPPIVGRLESGSLLLDLRTIAPHHDDVVIAALAARA